MQLKRPETIRREHQRRPVRRSNDSAPPRRGDQRIVGSGIAKAVLPTTIATHLFCPVDRRFELVEERWFGFVTNEVEVPQPATAYIRLWTQTPEPLCAGLISGRQSIGQQRHCTALDDCSLALCARIIGYVHPKD